MNGGLGPAAQLREEVDPARLVELPPAVRLRVVAGEVARSTSRAVTIRMVAPLSARLRPAYDEDRAPCGDRENTP